MFGGDAEAGFGARALPGRAHHDPSAHPGCVSSLGSSSTFPAPGTAFSLEG